MKCKFDGKAYETTALSCAGLLVAETMPDQLFQEASQIVVNVESSGPFPYRILYLHSNKDVKPGVTLRWSGHIVSSAANGNDTLSSGSGSIPSSSPGPVGGAEWDGTTVATRIFVFQNIPAGRLFTDAKMERSKLLTGSIEGPQPKNIKDFFFCYL
jgi:hypothetical protein